MAYSTRGTRPIVVNGMSFRWHTDPVHPVVVVWHVLDAGRLTILYPDPTFDPTPGFVARAVERALANGWRTDDHRQIEQSAAEFREADGFSNRSRVIALPGLDNLLDHEAEVLEAPDVDSFPTADAVLQLVMAPSFVPACVLTLWAEGDAGFAHLAGVVDSERTDWVVEAEADWIRDAIVSVRCAPPATAGKIVLDGMPTRVTLRDPSGTWTEMDNAPEDDTPLHVATLAGWRIAMEVFAGTEAARDVVEGLHPYIDPGVLPLHRDEDNRILRLYGAWSWPVGQQLVETLRTCAGPWIIDARKVTVFAGLTAKALRQHQSKRSVPLFWVLAAEHTLPFPHHPDVPTAEVDRMFAGRAAVERVVLTLDPRWQSIASEALLSHDIARVQAANLDLERWLSEGWAPLEIAGGAGWSYADGTWKWCDTPPEVGLSIGGHHAWLTTPDGRTLGCPL